MATMTAAPTRTFRSARGLVCALACGAAIGCTASGADVQPVRDQLAFPTGMKVSPDGKVLFVVNANSELRFDSGSLDVVDLGRVQGVIAPWLTYLGKPTAACTDFADGVPSMAPSPADGGKKLSCACDPNNTQTLVCDEAYFINPNAGVRVGNFATDLSVQNLGSGANPLRVFVPTRGDPSVAWADFDGTSLHCAAGSDPYPLCDDAHRLTSLYNDPDLEALPNEPFAVFADAFPSVDAAGNPVTHGFAMVTHLASGAVTLIDAPADSSKVQISDILIGVFGDPSTAARGATSIAALRPLPKASPPPPQPPPPPPPPGQGEGVPELVPESLYVVSNTDNRVQQFTVGMRNGAAGYLVPGTFFLLDAVGMMAGGSGDSRAIQFSADTERLYLVNRAPPSLQVWDTSIGLSGTPNNRLLGSSDLCRQGSAAAVAGASFDGHTFDNSNERVYVTCFQDGQIYIVDPFGQSQVEDIVSVGRGPYTAVALRTEDLQSPAPPNYLFVSNFLEDTIAVIDITPGSPTRHRVVLRIGTPRSR
jgi:DNA-binding beta-propeller fold protein YncE